MVKKKFSCLIVGLGSIGMMYDYDLYSRFFQTHTSSILKSKYFSLIGGVDTDYKKRQLFRKKYDLDTFSNINEIDRKKIDLLILCTPYETHFTLLKEVLKKFKIKVILCEKPFTDNVKNAKKIKSIIRNKKVKIFINYSRISDISTDFIKKKILNKKNLIGKVFYSKSLINNCSHFINLFKLFLGNPVKYELISKKKNIFRLKFKNAIVDFCKKDQFKSNNFFLYNNEFKLEYRINNDHIVLFKNNNKKIILSYGKNINFYVIKNLENYLNNKNYKLCDIDDAIDTHKILKKIKNLKSI